MNVRVKQLARDEGYDLAGISAPFVPPADVSFFREFVARGLFGTMDWFARHNDLRVEPARIFQGARSVLMLGAVYRTDSYEKELNNSKRKISRYAAGRDYHRALRKRGKRLLAKIQALVPGTRGRIMVDSAPVPEKILARQAGLGWQGKHTNLIHPELGSYFFLSALFLDLELAADEPIPDLCGRCRLCVDACPTGALEEYRIDARRCISYLTIEHTGPVASEFHGKMAGWVFGCDICQEVCPYNRSPRGRRAQTREPAFLPRASLVRALQSADPGDEGDWNELKSGSPLGRIDLEKWRENLARAQDSGSRQNG